MGEDNAAVGHCEMADQSTSGSTSVTESTLERANSAVRYDVFLSYSRSDSYLAAEINDFLRGAGLKVFFDRDELLAGRRWIDDLEKALGESRSAIVLIGPAGFGNTQQYERQLALIRHAKEPTFSVIPTLLPGTIDPPASFLNILTWVDLRALNDARNDTPKKQDLLKALANAVQAGTTDVDSLRDALCPYRGLDSFREEDAALFFGRGSTDDPGTPLGELARKVQEQNFVAVVGRSGSGKSSLVFAGLLPALRQRRDQFWDIVTVRPGANPLRALAECFNPRNSDDGPTAYTSRIGKEVDALRDSSDPELLRHLVAYHLKTGGKGNERLLLYVDQWEELYAQAPRPEEKDRAERHRTDVERFITLLVRASEPRSDHAPICTVIISVRADFYDHLIRHKELGRILPRQQVNIGAMSKDDLRRTIFEPAAKVGLTFDPPALVDKILDETGNDEGMLPLLQYALKETWANRDGKRLTTAAYDQSGGVKGAIIKTADKAFAMLSSEQKHSASQLFLRLVSPGEGQEDSRVRAAKPANVGQQKIVEMFSGPRTRLLVTGSDGSGRGTVEVAHEALIRTWPKLRAWIDDNRGKLRARSAVLQSRNEWEANGRRRDLLLRSGYQLERARELLKDPGDVSVEDIADYIEESKKREDRASLLYSLMVLFLAISAPVSIAAAVGIWFFFHEAKTNLRSGTKALSVLTDVIDKRVLLTARVAEANQLLTAAEGAVKQFPEGAASDPGVALELARLKLTSADLEMLRKLGNAPTTLSNARSASTALTAIVDADKNNLEARYELAHSEILIGRVLADSDPFEAQDSFNAAIKRLNAILAESGGNTSPADLTKQLSDAKVYLGDLLIDKFNKLDEAKKFYDEARDDLKQLQSAFPKTYGIDRDIAWAINKQADVQLRERNIAGALDGYQEARDRLKLIDDSGHLWDNADWVYTLVIIDNNIALLQRDLGMYGSAIETLKEARADLYELVHHHDPDNLSWKSTLGWTLDNAGWLYFLSARGDRDRLELARTTFVQALQIRDGLLSGTQHDLGDAGRSANNAATNPTYPVWQSDADYTRANIDVVIATETDLDGNHCSAAQKFIEASALNNKATTGDMERQALRTMWILDWGAAAYRAAGDMVDAQHLLQEATDISKKYIAKTKLQAFRDESSTIQNELTEIQGLGGRGQCPTAQ
jgi:tetratricopeptide (TPR) repeat protein/energy-coupling factor transporter ATP-binding protein EcfA2